MISKINDRSEASTFQNRFSLNSNTKLRAYKTNSPNRSAVEKYIHNHFLEMHEAEINDFMPYLISLDVNEEYKAVVGVRAASSEILFLEQYFDSNIETYLSNLDGKPVSRKVVVELGNLVCSQAGASQLLFLILASLLKKSNYEWVVFTATPKVKKSMERLGAELHILGDANPEKLSSKNRSTWGNYYDTQPVILVGRVSEFMSKLKESPFYLGILKQYEQQAAALSLVIDESGQQNVRSFTA